MDSSMDKIHHPPAGLPLASEARGPMITVIWLGSTFGPRAAGGP